MPGYATPEQFMALMRQGRRPDGSAIRPYMPISSFKHMNDTDLQALYVFLKSEAPVARTEH